MRPRTLGILLLLVAGLAAFAWFVDRDLPGSEEREENAKQVLRFDAETVSALVIERGGERVRLEGERPAAEPSDNDADPAADPDAAGPSRPRRWRLTEPLAAQADSAKVRSLLSDLGSLESQREVEEADRAALGLDSPRARVTLERDGGEPLVLEIGAEVPSSDSMLVAIAGAGSAQVVGKRLFDALVTRGDEWRDRNLFAGERAKIERIRLAPAGAAPVVLARQGAEYRLESPVSDRADRDQVDRLVTDLVGLTAQAFLDDGAAEGAIADPGLEPPRGVVTVSFSDGTALLELALGAEVPDSASRLYARAGGQQVEIDDALFDWLSRPVESWRSKRWTSFDGWEIDGATVTDAAGSMELRREGADWLRAGERIPFTEVGDLFAVLADAEALEVTAPPPAGAPTLTLELSGREGREETLTLFAELDGRAPARVSDRDAVLMLSTETAADLQAKLAAVRAAEVLPEPDLDENGIEITAEEGDDPI